MVDQRDISADRAPDYMGELIGTSLNDSFERRGFRRDNTLDRKIQEAIAPLLADLATPDTTPDSPLASRDRALLSAAAAENMITQFGEQNTSVPADNDVLEDPYDDIEPATPAQTLPTYGAVDAPPAPANREREVIASPESSRDGNDGSEDTDESREADLEGSVDIPDTDDELDMTEDVLADTDSDTSEESTADSKTTGDSADETADPALVPEDSSPGPSRKTTNTPDENIPTNTQAAPRQEPRIRPGATKGVRRQLAALRAKEKSAIQSIARLKNMFKNQRQKLAPLERPYKMLVILRRTLLVLSVILLVIGGALSATFFLAAIGVPMVTGGIWIWRTASALKLEITALKNKIDPLKRRIKKIEKAIKLRTNQMKSIRSERRLIILYGQPRAARQPSSSQSPTPANTLLPTR